MEVKSISTGAFQWMSSNNKQKNNERNEPPKFLPKNQPSQSNTKREWYTTEKGAPQYSSDNPYVSQYGKELTYEDTKIFQEMQYSKPQVKWNQFGNYVVQPQPNKPVQNPNIPQQPPFMQRPVFSIPNQQSVMKPIPSPVQPTGGPVLSRAPSAPMPQVQQGFQAVPQGQPQLQRRFTAPVQGNAFIQYQPLQVQMRQPTPQHIQRPVVQPRRVVQPRPIPQRNAPIRFMNPVLLPNQPVPPANQPLAPNRPPNRQGPAKVLQTRPGNVVTIPQTQNLLHINNKAFLAEPPQLAIGKQPRAHQPFGRPVQPRPVNGQNRPAMQQRRTLQHPYQPPFNPALMAQRARNGVAPGRTAPYHSVLTQVKVPTKGTKTQNLLDYDHRLHGRSRYDHPYPSTAPNQPAAPPPAHKDKWHRLFQEKKIATHITKYLTPFEFVNLFGLLSQDCHRIQRELPYIDEITLLLTQNDSTIKLKETLFFVTDLQQQFASLSPVNLRKVRFDISLTYSTHDVANIFECLHQYLSKSKNLELISIKGPDNCSTILPQVEQSMLYMLSSLRFQHLEVIKKPFQMYPQFIKACFGVPSLTLSEEFLLTIEQIQELPSTLKSLTICRPDYPISLLIEKLPTNVQLSKIYIRNPLKKHPLDPYEIESLFTSIPNVHLDFSLVGLPPASPNGLRRPHRVECIKFYYDGCSAQLTKTLFDQLPTIPVEMEYQNGNLYEYKRCKMLLLNRGRRI